VSYLCLFQSVFYLLIIKSYFFNILNLKIMKVLTFSLSTVLVFFVAFSHAATLVVNNSVPAVVGEYATINAAIAASATGDVILVKGTSTAYGDANINDITKSLTFVGNGYNPKTVSTNATTAGYFYLGTGVKNINIRGFNCSGVFSNGGDNDNIDVEFCKINVQINVGGSNCDDWFISNCIFPTSNSYIIGSNPTNVIIEHCYMGSGIQLGVSAVNILVRNNVFANNANYSAFGTMGNAIIINNIFYNSFLVGSNAYLGSASYTSCVISNNVTYNSAGTNPFPTNTGGNSGNTIAANSVDVNPNFVSYPVAAPPFAFTQDFRLQAGSPALTAGVGSTQIGLYGNSFPFSMTGEPRIPAVRSMTINTPATNSGVGSTINVNIEASKARPN
jgi:hypothetical protein